MIDLFLLRGRWLLRLAGLAVGLFLLPQAGGAQDAAPTRVGQGRPTVIWGVPEFPPLSIRTGPNAGIGIIDHMLADYTGQMADFDHQFQNLPFARLWAEIAERDGFCQAGILKSPERAQVAAFSQPVLHLPPLHLHVRADRMARLSAVMTPQGEIDFPRLENSGLTGAVTRGRSYTRELDAQIARIHDTGHIIDVSWADNVPQMLAAGRIDWIIAYEPEVRYALNGADRSRDILALPIAGVPPVLDAYVACSNRRLGLAVIAAVNHIAEQSDPAEGVEALKPWMSEETYTRFIRKLGVKTASP